MKTLLTLASLGEGLVGLMLAIDPSVIVRLLFGEPPAGTGVIAARIAGFGLIGLGRACLPWRAARAPAEGMLLYGTLAAGYLVVLGLRHGPGGPLLWPAAILHAAITAALVFDASRMMRPRR